MDAAPLTTTLSMEYDQWNLERRERRGSFSENETGAVGALKKLLLGRRASRSYHALERREPRRLKKKALYR